MHEIGVAKEVLGIALGKADGRKVVRIQVELGDDGHTTPESLKHAFEMAAKGTLAEKASLDVTRGSGLESRVVELEVEK